MKEEKRSPEDSYRLLQVAVNAAIAAGREVMDVYRREYTVTEKDDRSPLTEADTRSHRTILRYLATDTPDLPVLSEEGAHLPYAERRRWGSYWLVDPLDGTKEFIKHNDEFTVNIAMIAPGSITGEERVGAAPLLGVVYLPAMEALYAGIRGVGAWRLPCGTEGSAPTVEQIQTDGVTLPDPELIEKRPWTVVASRSHMSPPTEAFIRERQEEYPDLDLISSGSSLKICRVAEGAADEYPRFAPTMEWDTAAGDAVARAAGCEVLQWDEKTGPAVSQLEYNKEDLHNPWFLVRRETK